jgi:hypothetical protein
MMDNSQAVDHMTTLETDALRLPNSLFNFFISGNPNPCPGQACDGSGHPPGGYLI